MKSIFVLVVLAGVLSASAFAAVIEGTVYGEDLQPLAAVVSVDTRPVQTVVAGNGSYSLQVPPGKFEITAASAGNSSIRETRPVEVAGEGTYAIDFVLVGDSPGELADLLRELGEASGIEEDAGPDAAAGGGSDLLLAGALALVAVACAAYYLLGRKGSGGQPQDREEKKLPAHEQPRDEEPQKFVEDEKQVLEKLREAGGLLSQKDLRKALPFWSEARVSLVVSALEKQGKLKSIKQGRGNILKLIE